MEKKMNLKLNDHREDRKSKQISQFLTFGNL